MNANKKRALAACFTVASSLAALSLTSVARAGDAAAAEALFNEARRLMTQGNFAAACPQLEESQRLDPGMGTLYNLGDCYEKTGKVASAWAAFLDVAAQAKGAGQAAREADARGRATALEPKLSRLTLAVEGPAATTEGLTIKRDGIDVGRAQWGLALPVDPGEHTLAVSAPGKKTATLKVQVLGNGANVRFGIPALEDAPAAAAGPVPQPTTQPAGAVPAPDVTSSDDGKTQRTIGLVVGGVGIVGLGVGAVFGLQSMSKKSDGDKHCVPNNDSCDAEGVAARDDARSAGTLSTVFFAVGGVATAAGVVLFFTAPKATDKKMGMTFSPTASRDGGGFLLRGSFQ